MGSGSRNEKNRKRPEGPEHANQTLVVAGTISHRNCIVYFIEIHSDHDNRNTVVPVEKICREDKNMPRRQTAVLDVIIVNDNIMGRPVCFRAAISGSKASRMDTASSFRNMST